MGTAPDREPKEWFAQYEVLPLYVRLLDVACWIVGGLGLGFFCLAALCLVHV